MPSLPPATSTATPSRTCSIALVEDDASFSRAVARLLRASGFETEAFASAEDFLASPKPETWPCLILDLQLPGLSGFKLLDHLFTLAPPRPAIFVTAQDDDDVHLQASRYPGSVLLHKPIVGAELLTAVRAQLPCCGLPPAPGP